MSNVPTRVVAVTMLVVALALAGVVSNYASSEPDGLNRVAADQGFSDRETRNAAEDSPLAGYEAEGIGEPSLARGVAGVVGALVVLLLAGATTYAVRRRTPAGTRETADSS
jgi:hypothetical protein